jgi:56kDa selenium binding protein (SBP56)
MAMRGVLLIRPVLIVLVATFFVGGSGSSLENVQSSHFSPYLYVWAGGEDRQNSDFLAVIDALPESKSYGQVISTTSVNESGTMPHHTEYEFPKDGVLFANGWAGNKTFIFDLRSPTLPRITRQFGSLGGYSFLHSMVRLPNGHVLATFQGKGNAYVPTGALVELDEQGQVVRLSSASAPGVKDSLIWPYSLAVLATVDRVVTSSFVMGFPDGVSLPSGSWSHSKINSTDTKHIQIWSLSKLTLLSTIALPPSPEGDHGLNPSEPRVLSDGSVYVGTFNCGLYHLHGLTEQNPSVHFVFAFPGGDLNKTPCGVPVVVGKFWVQTVAALPGLIVLDVSNPELPREVSRLIFDDRFRRPHWIAADRQSARLVVTGSMESWLLLVNIDEGTGKLSVDNAFRETGHDEAGLDFAHIRGPEGKTGVFFPHGALFGPN